MIRYLTSMLLLVMLLNASPQTASNDFAKLNWLIGNWKSLGAGPHFYERWERVGPDELSNINYSLCSGEAVISERGALRLEGKEIFAGGGTDRWRVTYLTDREIVLENPEIDYARKITHRLTAEGNWHARIEGQHGVIEYLLSRVASLEELMRHKPQPIIGQFAGEVSVGEKSDPIVFDFDIQAGRQRLRIIDPKNRRPDVTVKQLCYDPPQLKFGIEDGPKLIEFVAQYNDDEIHGHAEIEGKRLVKIRLKKPTKGANR